MTYIKVPTENKLYMNFQGDSSEGYCHNLSDYMDLISQKYIAY
jgi:hypothetical protein